MVLTDAEQLNYFPASPLFAMSVMLLEELHAVDKLASLNGIKQTPKAPKFLSSAPNTAPHRSWSPGPIKGFIVASFPDPWRTLGGGSQGTPLEGDRNAIAQFFEIRSRMPYAPFSGPR